MSSVLYVFQIESFYAYYRSPFPPRWTAILFILTASLFGLASPEPEANPEPNPKPKAAARMSCN